MNLTKKEKQILRSAIDFWAYHRWDCGGSHLCSKGFDGSIEDVTSLLKKLNVKKSISVVKAIKLEMAERKLDMLEKENEIYNL